ncbi:MAG: ABC transporter ATP-binding protein, partial [Candidatus Dormibacteraeota bacterium]|nr:ABC transporter ATP-binding protein [Candidatus Dormibacteraeota bacterium]
SYFRDLALTGGAAKEIRLFGLAGWVVDCFRAEWASAMERIWRDRGRRRVLSTTVLLVASAANFGAYALLGVDAVHGVIGLGALAASLYAVHQVWYVARLTPLEPHIAYGMSAVPAVLELEQTIARQQEPSGRQPAEDAPRAAIEFHNVSFAYPGSSAAVLDRLDLVIPAGRSMAVVGANGAGKTTLVKLLCRLYDPDQGSITVDGSDLEELDAGAWQRRLAAIFQDFTRFELSARENVALGTEGRRAGSEALERAAARAGVLERVRALPKGWDTPLTRHLDFGADLSGGEWQRIALARALYAVEAGARVLILDEPTASLDVRAEAAFYDRFLELTRGLTTILISHRFSTVRRADLICVLDHGRVAELGSHDELMARGARYASLFTLQSAHFLDDAGLEEEPV